MNAYQFTLQQGLNEAKKLLEMGSGHCNIDGYQFHTDELKQAVSDVENSIYFKLNAPARVGGVVFRENIPWKTVIECAQRHYDYGQRDVQATPVISPQTAIKLAMGQLILMPTEPTQEMYRAYIESANPENSRNAAESFRNGYKEMIQICQEK